MSRLTKETLFKPSKAESKQAATDATARSMIEAEAQSRQKKTDRLREMRLAMEAERGEADAPRKKQATKARRVKRRP